VPSEYELDGCEVILLGSLDKKNPDFSEISFKKFN
jgi:hypothetical protein